MSSALCPFTGFSNRRGNSHVQAEALPLQKTIRVAAGDHSREPPCSVEREYCPHGLSTPRRLICQSLGALFANSHDRTSFEAKPVNASNDKEDEERELEDRYSADHIQHRDAAPGSKDRI